MGKFVSISLKLNFNSKYFWLLWVKEFDLIYSYFKEIKKYVFNCLQKIKIANFHV